MAMGPSISWPGWFMPNARGASPSAVTIAVILGIIWLPQLMTMLPRVDTSEMPAAAWWLWAPGAAYMKLRVLAFEWGSTAVLAAIFALLLIGIFLDV